MKRLLTKLQIMMKSLRTMTGDSDDPRYSDEKLLLRAAYALEKQLSFWDIRPDI